jgi:probable rRNA maturation factor
MRFLNRQFRGVDRTTDVLSFPQQESYKLKNIFQLNSLLLTPYSSLILGDIVINLHKAKRQAREYGNTFDQELKRLLIHGLLHLLGYDHEKGKYAEREMQKKTEEILTRI